MVCDILQKLIVKTKLPVFFSDHSVYSIYVDVCVRACSFLNFVASVDV